MFKKFPSIVHFHQVVQEITDRHQYIGKDENDKALFDRTKPLPTISFTQTVKIHGTNGGVILFKDGTIRTQSRNRLLDEQNDNLGFCKWVNERADVWHKISECLFAYDEFIKADKIVVYGEFAGENIQPTVVLRKTPKSFYVFEVVAFKDGQAFASMDFFEYDFAIFEQDERNIYSIFQFPTKHRHIDLNNPEQYIDELQQIALAIEQECPVGLYHGISGIGEGAVFTGYYNGDTYRFKVKGAKHQASRLELLPSVNSVMIADVKDFVAQVVTENRLQQGIDYLKEMQLHVDITSTGAFIKWVVNDVHKEEYDIILKKDFDKKLINQEVSRVAKRFYFDKVGVK